MFMAATLAHRARRKTLNGMVAYRPERVCAQSRSREAGSLPGTTRAPARLCTSRWRNRRFGTGHILERSITEAMTLRFPPPRD